MTTIAWDGKTLAADSQSTAGNVILSLDVNKIITPDESESWTVRGHSILAFAASGDSCVVDELREALVTGLHSKTMMRRGLDFTAIAISGNDSGFEIHKIENEDEIKIFRLHSPRAFGSGDDFALSAMRMGMNAEDAVKHAIEIDIYSGGNVSTFTASHEEQFKVPMGKEII